MTAVLQLRGSGLLDDLPPDAGAHAAARAYERLDERTAAIIDAAVDDLVAGLTRRRKAVSAGLGRGGALELLAAIGRMV